MHKEQDYTKKLDFRLWRTLYGETGDVKKYLLLLAFVMVGVGAVDALFPLMQKIAVDDFIMKRDFTGLYRLIGWYAVLLIAQTFFVFALIWLGAHIESKMTYRLRQRGFLKLQELSFNYYDRTPVGWIMSRMTSDCNKLGEIISWGIVDLVWGTAIMIFIGFSMLIMNWRLGLLVLCVMPVLGVVSWFFQQKILRSNRDVRKINSQISASYNEGIMGAKTTKTLVREERNLHEFKKLSGKMKQASIRMAAFSAFYLPVIIFLSTIGTSLSLVGGSTMLLNGAISAGTIVAFVAYTVHFFEPAQELARVISEFQSAQAAGERIVSLLGEKIDLQDKPEIRNRYGSPVAPKRNDLPKPKGEIEFREVSFAYSNGQKVLEDFSLKVSPGETVALVGETGCGKSTIVNLACRFYEPQKGHIYLDGGNLQDKPLHWLHHHYGYVLQTPHLFSGTIAENIRYGKLGATDEEVREAARIAQAYDLVSSLSDGFETEVGEGGSMLSTGERQLISFARAILADPAVMVLDEATSSIDTETEKKIQNAIHTLLEDRTSFVIAHRLSTVKDADRILVINEGQIIESGKHDQLMEQKNMYYQLYMNQFAS